MPRVLTLQKMTIASDECVREEVLGEQDLEILPACPWALASLYLPREFSRGGSCHLGRHTHRGQNQIVNHWLI